ncbi:MAG: hypothetical protein MK171_11900 [Pirellulales bacterium]|nr:hypothetical protein [Pirellulales bacterium]
MTIRILALWTLSFTGPIALVIGGLKGPQEFGQAICGVAAFSLVVFIVAPRQKGVMDWVMFSGGALMLATPLSVSFILLGFPIFSFGFLMERQHAKAELLSKSLKSGGDGAQDGSSK